jgi:hypothetical protein
LANPSCRAPRTHNPRARRRANSPADCSAIPTLPRHPTGLHPLITECRSPGLPSPT